MTREFIMLPTFDKQWASMGLTDKELKSLQEELTINPSAGDVMQGTGGLRKIRIAFENRSKSRSARVCYVDFVRFERIYLISAYPKSEKDNLSKEQRNDIKKLVRALHEALKERDEIK